LTVQCLDLQKNDNVLEMCCSPGAKLLYISDILSGKDGEGNFSFFSIFWLLNPTGVVIGNDISLPRLQITKNLINKYQKSSKIYLLNQDARNLPGKIDLNMLKQSKYDHIYELSETQKEEKIVQIDKILVDVECSHDGSLKHILKYFLPQNFKPKKTKTDQPIVILSNKEKKRRAKQNKINAKKSIFKKKTHGQ
jgi:16S rRNA C967 or C1407 C5-methylase (RsmB/RsmF family)